MKPEPRVEGCFEDTPHVSMDRFANYVQPRWDSISVTSPLTDAAIRRYQRRGRYRERRTFCHQIRSRLLYSC